MSDFSWSDYGRAYKAIFDAQQDIASVATDIDKVELTKNADGTIATLKKYKGATLLFTLTFTYFADGSLQSISRS